MSKRFKNIDSTAKGAKSAKEKNMLTKKKQTSKTKTKAWLKAHGHDRLVDELPMDSAAQVRDAILLVHGVKLSEYLRAGGTR